jgi:hypothetical protein
MYYAREKEESLQGFGGQKIAGSPEIPRRRRQDNITMNLTELGWGRKDWFHLAQDSDKRRVPNKAIFFSS